jgi:hypothetical protein
MLTRRSRTSATRARGRPPRPEEGDGTADAAGAEPAVAAGLPEPGSGLAAAAGADDPGSGDPPEPGDPPAKIAAPRSRATPPTPRRVIVIPVQGRPRRPGAEPRRAVPCGAVDPDSGRAIGGRRGGWRGGIGGIVAQPRRGAIGRPTGQSPTLYGYVTQP